MLKYEEKLHFNKHYEKWQSLSVLRVAIGVIWRIAGYILLYFLFKYILRYIPDLNPWDNTETWFRIGVVRFVRADLAYFVYGIILTCYGGIRLAKITAQNHSAKNQKDSMPQELLITSYYAKVRHSMYGTFIILQASFLLSLRSFTGMILALIVVTIQYLNAFFEEKKHLLPVFGEEYNRYVKNVRRMILTNRKIIVFLLLALSSMVGFAS